jgi:CRP-like cAMP-binding protein
VQAITDVDLLEIEYTDYLNAQDKDATHMTMEERLKFLQSCSVFKVWDSFRLMRLTHYIEQTEVGKGNVIKERGTSKDFHVIVEGKVNVVSNLKMNYVLTTLSSGDSFGEEGIINKFTKNATLKLTDPFTYIAYSKVHLLTLPASHFGSFDPRTLEFIKSTYATKSKWRNERSLEMKLSRARVRRFVRSNKRIDPFRVPAQYESLLSGDIVGDREGGDEVGGEAMIINSEMQRLPTDKNHLALLSPSRSPSPVRSNAESDSIEQMKRTPSNIVRNLLLSRGDLEDYATTAIAATSTQQSNHGTILLPPQQLDDQPASSTAEVTDGGIAFSPALKRSSRPRSAPAVPGRLHSTAAMEEDSLQLLNVNKASLESNEGNIRVSTVRPHSAVLVPVPSSTNDDAAATSRPKSAAHAASRSRTPDDALLRPSSSAAAISSNKPAISLYSESKSQPTYLKRMTHSNGKLRDLEDIPTLLAQDMDFFLASMNCRTDRQKQYFSSSIASALRPKSARITGHSAIGLREISGPLAKRRIMNNDYQIVTGDKVMINATKQRPSSSGFPRASKS